MSKHKRGHRRRGTTPQPSARIRAQVAKSLRFTNSSGATVGVVVPAGASVSALVRRNFSGLTDGPEPTMLRCADRDQTIEDQVGYLVLAELRMGMRDAAGGNERDDVGVNAEARTILGNVVGYD